MRATSLLLGCLLGLGLVANAMAASSSVAANLGSSSSENCTNQPADHTPARDIAPNGNGDGLGAVHSSTPPSTSSHPSNGNSSVGSDATRFNDDASPNHSSHGSGLSWQSLLPGSIQ